MTPDMLEEGTRRREAYLARIAQNRAPTASGGQGATFGHVVASDVVDISNGGILYVDDITVSFDGFRALAARKELASKTAILETPGKSEDDERNMQTIRAIFKGVAART